MDFIKGGTASDERGQIRFVNDFDLSEVRRFYIIKNWDTSIVRGWRAHKIEQRWFYVIAGSFSVDIVSIENWISLSPDSPVDRIVLSTSDQRVLHLPTGYGTAFQALEDGSELLVFADYPIENALNDDYTYPLAYFNNRSK